MSCSILQMSSPLAMILCMPSPPKQINHLHLTIILCKDLALVFCTKNLDTMSVDISRWTATVTLNRRNNLPSSGKWKWNMIHEDINVDVCLSDLKTTGCKGVRMRKVTMRWFMSFSWPAGPREPLAWGRKLVLGADSLWRQIRKGSSFNRKLQ